MDNDFEIIDVHCCVCHGSGKVPRLVLFKRECPVCDGKGKRPILLARSFTPDIRASVIESAFLGSPLCYQAPTLSESLGLGGIW